jgi:hypothetical protein
MASLSEEILRKTLDELKGSKEFPDNVYGKLETMFTKGKITKNNLMSVLDFDLGEEIET